MTTPRATIAGVPILTRGNVEWTIAPGTAPQQQTFLVEAGRGKDLETRIGVPVQLLIETRTTTLTVSNLYVLSVLAGEDPWTRNVLVSDRRWLWPRKHVLRRYNVRRRTGIRPLVSADAVGNLPDNAEVVQYARWSLKNNTTPWNGEDILRDIMPIVAQANEWSISDRIPPHQQLVVDSLEIDDSFDSALNQILSYLPGYDVFVNLRGEIGFYNRSKKSRFEAPTADEKGRVVVETGWTVPMRNLRLRPKRIHVLFSREFEVRLDAKESGDAELATSSGPGLAQIENVIPVTDPSLALPSGQTVIAGTWLTVDQILAAWNAAGGPPGGLPPISRKIIRETWFYGLEQYVLAGQFDPDISWATRIGAIRQHFRQTYRIKRDFMDRVYQVAPYRVAVLDPTTGTRASAQAWSDYTIKASGRGVFVEAGKQVMPVVVRAYQDALNSARLTPMTVSLMDSEQGIFRVGFRGDTLGLVEELIPSAMKNLPTCTASFQNKHRWYYEKSEQGAELPQLDPDHGLAVVFTVSYGSPNDNRQLETVTVRPEEAEALIPGASFLSAEGPEVELRIGPGIMTAKYAWVDDARHKANISTMFGFSGGLTAPQGQAPDLRYAWINVEECEGTARAVAAAYYAALVDHLQGGHGLHLQPDLTVSGVMDSVRHSLDTSGRALTYVSFPAVLPQMANFLSLLPASARKMILREVQPR